MRLRRLGHADLAALHAIESREDVARWLYWEPRTEAETYAFIVEATATPEAKGATLAVEPLAGGGLIGRVSLMVERAHRQAEIGFVFHPDQHGRGYATEAGRALLRLAFERYGLHRVYGRLEPRNTGSARVLEKLGMRREALLVENEWIKGEWQSEAIYALLDREWRDRRPSTAAG